MNPALAKIVAQELAKLEALSRSDILLTGEQLSSLEVLARILQKAPKEDGPLDTSLNVADALSIADAMGQAAPGAK